MNWELHQGDCMELMTNMEPSSVDMSVYSPPFPAVYAYTSSPADIGNSEDLKGEAKIHLSFFFKAIRRLIKPGRVMLVHCQDIVKMKRTGGEGLFDFRGLLIRIGERAGFIHDYSWTIRKNPQSQAIRTKSRELQFSGLESDRAKSRGALPDYLIKFRVPGENETPISGQEQVSRNQWIEWAECTWSDIRETDTLNVRGTKGDDDTKHIAPLQLSVIDRAVRLYTNPGELVFSPFAGIGSEGYASLKLGRRFVGCELKEEYFEVAKQNLAKAEREREADNRSLFDTMEPANA